MSRLDDSAPKGSQLMKSHNLLAAAAGTLIALSAVVISLPHRATAQTNPTLTNIIPNSESATLQARITAINRKTRAVTLVGSSGDRATVTAGPAVRLEKLKVGDRVNAQYYRSVAFMVKPPAGGNGTPVSDDQITQIIAQPAQAPGGIAVRLTKVSGTVVGIDLAAHRIDLVSPAGGGVYTIDVTEPSRIAMLGSLKVGDTITAAVSQALAVSIEPAPKRWF
jgi:hypothetical protein